MDRSQGIGELMQLLNQNSIYSYLRLSTCHEYIMERMKYSSTRVHDHFS